MNWAEAALRQWYLFLELLENLSEITPSKIIVEHFIKLGNWQQSESRQRKTTEWPSENSTGWENNMRRSFSWQNFSNLSSTTFPCMQLAQLINQIVTTPRAVEVRATGLSAGACKEFAAVGLLLSDNSLAKEFTRSFNRCSLFWVSRKVNMTCYRARAAERSSRASESSFLNCAFASVWDFKRIS